ncbi:hypothetical protein E2C01_088882 [Portunus trituberculatus]|uniref:Ig-like domain-containing protein n=1 Tax=Portunus trituberculatus TaxID=210409 RepID=A0A5B7JC11_PORTR|nr:hypothetical protein [Portunus trituberculatus]
MMGNKTVSLLTFIPEAEDNGATLTCRAHNPSIPGQGMHTTTVLQVTCEYFFFMQEGKSAKDNKK